MNATSTKYERASRPLTAVVDAVPAAAWTHPSPCEGWTAGDVLLHIIDTQREFLTGHGVELGPAPDVAGDPSAAWRAHSQRVSEVIRDDAVVATGYDGHFGPTTIGATLEQFYMWDMVVHRWDIAMAAGMDDRLSDDELDRIEAGANSFGEALYMDGVCKPGVEAPADAPRQRRVLARLGRTG